MDLRTLLEQKFAEPVQCYGHCGELSRFTILADRPLIACYCCQSGYVSRIMAYGVDADPSVLKRFVEGALEGSGTVRDEDIRTATRNEWDFTRLSGGQIKATYWTQNYRRTKTDDPNRTALFLCSKCRSLFHQALTSRWTVCGKCRART